MEQLVKNQNEYLPNVILICQELTKKIKNEY